MTSDPEPILASWKISEVLERHPHLLDELVGLSPAFAKLRNPLLRRVQTRLVTVAQAAVIAKLEPAALVVRLNRAAGIATPDPESGNGDSPIWPAPGPAWAGTAPVARELDVRPLLARGEEPFRAITSAARDVPVGAVLRLHAGFEPVPLYDALGRQGFDHWPQEIEAGHWQVDFRRERDARAAVEPAGVKPSPPDDASGWGATADASVTIDVSELEPPGPMVKILEALEELPPGGRLLVHHVRVPIYLYPQLDTLGYAHLTRETGPGRVELLIHKAGAGGVA